MFLSRLAIWPKNKKDSVGVPQRLLRDYGRQALSSYVMAFGLCLVVAACPAATAYLFGTVVNKAYVNRDFPAVAMLSVAVIAIFAVKGLSLYWSGNILARVSSRMAAELQQRAFDKLLVHGLRYFARRHSSEFLHRVTRGSSAATKILSTIVNVVGKDVPMLIFLIAVMVVQEPLLSVIGMICMPVAILFVRGLVRRTREIAKRELKDARYILETLQETLRGLRVVKSFTLENEMQKRIHKSIEAVEKRQNAFARIEGRMSPLMETLGGISVALVLLYAGYRVIELNVAPGELLSFITAFLFAYEPAKRVAKTNIELARNVHAAEELFEILDSTPSEPEEPQLPDLRIEKGGIRFENVSFGYGSGSRVLQDVSFVAEAGKMTAFVGHSGGGKSTIIALIMRFYDIEDGRIEVDGTDIHQIPRRSLRRQIAYVGQDVFLFRGSIRDNILFGKLDATEDDVVAAAKSAYAHDFIMSLEKGYDTSVGEAGDRLSSGQRQRIAVARALIRNAPIILLDEATSALDSKAEREVQLAIDRLREGRTCIAVAHRLHTVTQANLICVIEEGRIIERGTYAELMQRNGYFAEMFRIQSMNEAAGLSAS
jgi:ATP-binding cassette, subfamily B, bacterial MsbA